MPRTAGPPEHLIFGSLPEFRRDPLAFFTRCARDYGDVCRFRLGHLRCCLVSSPDLVERVLVEHSDRTVKAWDYRQLRFILGDGLLTSDGERWERSRRIAQPAFHGDRLRNLAGELTRRARQHSRLWCSGDCRDVHEDMMDITLENVSAVLFGQQFSDGASDVRNALDSAMERFESILRAWVPLPHWVPTPGNLRARRAVARLDRALEEFVRNHRTTCADADDLLCWLIDQGYEGRSLRDEVVTFLLAGHETTALAVTWTLHLLSQHPEIAGRVAEELDRELGDGDPEPADLARLPHLEAVLRESMRLYPPAWAMGREVSREFELGDVTLSPGTQIFISQWAVHRDPRFWDLPEEFRPGRWMDEEYGGVSRPKYAYFPFGGGPRYCIGKKFAELEAMLLLATCLRSWVFEPVPEHPVELQPSVTLRPRYGLRLVVRRRRGVSGSHASSVTTRANPEAAEDRPLAAPGAAR